MKKLSVVSYQPSAKAGFKFTDNLHLHSIATYLLDASDDVRFVQDLLGHRHITTTQIYDKQR